MSGKFQEGDKVKILVSNSNLDFGEIATVGFVDPALELPNLVDETGENFADSELQLVARLQQVACPECGHAVSC